MSENLLIIDTDVGVDDALAILLALSNPSKCKVLAITCVAGNVGLSSVYTNTLRLLNFCGQVQNVPVYMGSKTALVHQTTPFHDNPHPPHGHDGFGGVSEEFPLPEDDLEVPGEPAAVAMTRIAAKHPGAVTLVALGPLTNVAIAHRLDPNFLMNLKELVIMGGTIEALGNEYPAAEFNFACDPEAASIVLSEHECQTRLVPYETCLKHSLDWDWFKGWTSRGTKNSDFVRRLTAHSAEWQHDMLKRRGYMSADLQTMAVVLDPSVTTLTESYPACVELHGTATRGMLVVDRRPSYRWHNKVPHIKFQLQFDESLQKDIFTTMVV